MAAGFPALGHDDFDTVAYGPPCRFDIADLLPHRHAGIAEEGQVLGRRVTPVERGDRYFLFGADADLGVIVKTGEEIDIEGGVGSRADLMDDGPDLFARCKPHANRSDPTASANPEGEVGSAVDKGHAGSGERMAAAEALCHTCRDAAHLI